METAALGFNRYWGDYGLSKIEAEKQYIYMQKSMGLNAV